MGFVNYVTYMVISPEPEMSAIFNLNLIRGHIVAFIRALSCRNRFSHLRENCANRLSVKLTEKTEIYRLCHLYGHISGTGSGRYIYFELDL